MEVEKQHKSSPLTFRFYKINVTKISLFMVSAVIVL